MVNADESTNVLTYASLEIVAQSKTVQEPHFNSQVECRGELKIRVGSCSGLDNIGSTDDLTTNKNYRRWRFHSFQGETVKDNNENKSLLV